MNVFKFFSEKLLISSLLLCGLSPFFILDAHDEMDFRFPKLHIQGRVSEGRYYGYDDLFSIALPVTSHTAEMEDFYAAPNVGGVAFFNQSGFLLKLEIDELIPEVTYLITKHPEVKHQILDALFYQVLLPQLKINVPKLRLLHEEKVNFTNDEQALFATLNLPETATLINLETGRSLDSKRGFLFFFTSDNKQLVSLSMQDTLSFIPTIAEAAKARLNERLLNHLIHYQKTFRLEE